MQKGENLLATKNKVTKFFLNKNHVYIANITKHKLYKNYINIFI